MSEPTDEDVAQFCEFLYLNSFQHGNLVRNALRSNNDRSALASEFWENQDAFMKKYGWDDSAFAADREGDVSNPTLSFSVDATEDAVIQGVSPPPEAQPWQGSVPPSRPPSRTNDRSPLGMVTDWTATAVSGAPNSSAQEDEDLARALRESAAESGVPQQESGITNTNSQAPHFGPANRDDYEADRWAMVPTGTSSQSARPSHPAPSERKRPSGAPSFLIRQPFGNATNNRLGSILTIMNEIPLARNVLLQTGQPVGSYGHSTEWWKGHVMPPHSQGQQWPQSPDQGFPEKMPDIHQEIHRLLAFLDLTERSYGSTDALAGLLETDDSTLERNLFDVLIEANDPSLLRPLLHGARAVFVKSFEPVQEIENFSFLDFELSNAHWQNAETLYDAWDHLAWDEAISAGSVQDDTKMVVLQNMGDVLTIQLNRGCPASLDVPEVWYPERYLDVRKDEARAIQEQLAWASGKIEASGPIEWNLTRWQGETRPHGPEKKRDILVKAIAKYETYSHYLEGLALFQEEDAAHAQTMLQQMGLEHLHPIMTASEVDAHEKVRKVVEHCKRELALLDAKTKKLSWERDQLRSYKRYLGTLLTDPEETKGPMLGKKYLLRGIAIGENITYVCRRDEAQEDLIQLDTPSTPVDTWWRLEFTKYDEKPVKVTKQLWSDVKQAIFSIDGDPLFVYATEEALNAPRTPLSDGLQRFMRADNKSFRQELNQEEILKAEREEAEVQTPKSPPTEVMTTSPSKRKFRSYSVDSTATNRASLGNSDTNSRAGDFADEETFDDMSEEQKQAARSEMIDMSCYATNSWIPESMEPQQHGWPQPTGQPQTQTWDAPLESSQANPESFDTRMEEDESAPPPIVPRSRSSPRDGVEQQQMEEQSSRHAEAEHHQAIAKEPESQQPQQPQQPISQAKEREMEQRPSGGPLFMSKGQRPGNSDQGRLESGMSSMDMDDMDSGLPD